MVLLVMMIVCILRNRTAMALASRRTEEGPPAPRSFSRRIRSSLASVWHLLVIVCLIGAFLVWWQNIKGRFFYLVSGTVRSALLFSPPDSLSIATRQNRPENICKRNAARKISNLTQHLNRYLPVVFFIIRAAITLVAIVVILEA